MFPNDTRIMIVDDVQAVRELLRILLSALGFTQFIEAEDGEIAFAALTSSVEVGQPVQLIIADWNMPNLNGIDLLKKVRATPEFKTVPFFMITAEGEFKHVLTAVQLGVSDYIVKPVTKQILETKLQGVWNRINNIK
jgi:two-component system, chemotaxis family, chemotaxis protein CheY